MFTGKTTVVLRRHRPWLELAGNGGCGASSPFAAPNRDPVLREALKLVFFTLWQLKVTYANFLTFCHAVPISQYTCICHKHLLCTEFNLT
ncbi:hypothetical protein ACQJBY_015161 [Aegilops geniculata]